MLPEPEIGQFHQQRVKNSCKLVNSNLLEEDKAWRSQERGMFPTSVCSFSVLDSQDIPAQCRHITLLHFFFFFFFLAWPMFWESSKGGPQVDHWPLSRHSAEDNLFCLEDAYSSKTRVLWVQEQDPGLRLQVQGYVLGSSLGKGKLLGPHWFGQVSFGDCVPRKDFWQSELDSSMINQPCWTTHPLWKLLSASNLCPVYSGPGLLTGVCLMGLRVRKYPVSFRVSMSSPGICIIVWSTTLGQTVNWSNYYVAKDFENLADRSSDTHVSTKATNGFIRNKQEFTMSNSKDSDFFLPLTTQTSFGFCIRCHTQMPDVSKFNCALLLLQ